MKIQSLRCPDCGASLSIDGELKQCFCQYCGAKIILDDGSTTHTYRKVDEARIKRGRSVCPNSFERVRNGRKETIDRRKIKG